MGYPPANLSGLFSTIGTATGFNTRIDRNFEFFDNVSYQHGRHTLTFGGYFFHLSFNPAFPNNARGTYTFNGSYSGNALADFLFGYPSQGQVGIGEGAENAHTNWAHFYFQDGWQLTPGLKVNLGIRYEYNSNLVAETNQTSNIDLSTGTARFVVAGNPANLAGNPARASVAAHRAGMAGAPTKQNGRARRVWRIHERGGLQRPAESCRKYTVLSEQDGQQRDRNSDVDHDRHSDRNSEWSDRRKRRKSRFQD